MKKINLHGISEILSEKELKNVMGGSTDERDLAACNNSKCKVQSDCLKTQFCATLTCGNVSEDHCF